MKQVKFSKKWRDQVDEATVHEYPAGWSGTVSNEVAERAHRAEVLDGPSREVTSAPKPAASKPSTKSKAKPKPATPAPSAPVTPVIDPTATDA